MKTPSRRLRMPIYTTVGLELRRLLGSRTSRAALVILVFVPLLYAGLYLWSLWDPQSRFDKIPVALVDADRGAKADGRALHAGRDLTRALVDRDIFDWHVVKLDEAGRGVSAGRYYMSLEIPADFSRRLASPSGTNPMAGVLHAHTNDANGYVAGSIARSVFSEVRAATSAKTARGYLDRIFISFGDLHDGIAKAADGAGRLAAGLVNARDGSRLLADGSGKLASGAGRAAGGAGQLAGGLGTAEAGSRQLAGGLGKLDTGAGRLAFGTARVANGTGQLAGRVNAVSRGVLPVLTNDAALVASGAQTVAAGADFVAGLPVPDATVGTGADRARLLEIQAQARRVSAIARRVANEAPTLAGRLRDAVAKINLLDDGAHRVAAGAARLHGGATTAAAGSGRLANGLGRLHAGSQQLAAGLDKLHAGALKLAAGNGRLHAGLTTAATGAHRLAGGLAGATRRIPKYDKAERDLRSGVMSNPVRLSRIVADHAANYGTASAAYFICLSLWVGAMVGFIMLNPLPPRALASTTAPWRAACIGYFPMASIAALQGLAVLVVLHFALGMRVTHPLGLVGFVVLTSLCFVAVVQWLNAQFGTAGRLLAIVLLLLQLTSSGGTYPVQTSPGFFNALHPVMPMSHALSGMRHLILGGDMMIVWHAALVLAAFTAGAMVLTARAARRMRVWTIRRLRPEVAV